MSYAEEGREGRGRWTHGHPHQLEVKTLVLKTLLVSHCVLFFPCTTPLPIPGMTAQSHASQISADQSLAQPEDLLPIRIPIISCFQGCLCPHLECELIAWKWNSNSWFMTYSHYWSTHCCFYSPSLPPSLFRSSPLSPFIPHHPTRTHTHRHTHTHTHTHTDLNNKL